MTTVSKLLEFCADKNTVIHKNESNGDQKINTPRNIIDASRDQISFIGSKFKDSLNEKVKNSQAGVLIIETSCFQLLKDDYSNSKTAFIVTNNPKKLLNSCIRQFFIEKKFIPIVHPSAIIDESVTLPKQINVGANAVIERNVTLGQRCTIEANAVIKENTVVGNDVIIKSGSIIGGTGFGYIKDNESDSYEVIPHFGKVIIEDKVHIGSNTCIDRGSLSDTIIKTGAKIDNLVHIAHNVEIGKNSLVIACSMIAGSVKIGDNCWVAPSVSVINGITVGDRAVLGLGSVVTKSVTQNQTVLGVPAIDIRSFKKLKNHQNKVINDEEN